MNIMASLVPAERIEDRIFLMRGQKVMLDRDLARLYEVPTKVLNQAVNRHVQRFPSDFMFRLTMKEARAWLAFEMRKCSRSQIVTLKRGQNIKHLPRAFTEHGILMLSSVINSERAIQVNIAIMRAFTHLRRLLSSHKELARRMDRMERRYDAQFQGVFATLRRLTMPATGPRRRIGFQPP